MKPNLAAALFAAALALPLAAGLSLAQQDHQHHHGTQAPAGESEATKASRAANDKMHRDMDIAFTGDADADFLRGMIPHHQGAIDMARIMLQYGKDPSVRKLAEDIIKA